MKLLHLEALDEALKGPLKENFPPAFLVLSKDSFEKKLALDALIKHRSEIKKGHGLSVKTFSGELLEAKDLVQELSSFELFSKDQIILVDQIEKLSKSASKEIERYLERPLDTICLILAGGVLNKQTALYKKLEKIAPIFEKPEEKPWEKEKHVMKQMIARFASFGKKIDPHALDYLIKHTGTDLATLYQEAEKLHLFTDDKKIVAIEDVQAVVCPLNLSTIWQFGEAVFQRNTKACHSIFHALLNDGNQLLSLLRGVRYLLQTSFQIAEMAEDNFAQGKIEQRFPQIRGNLLQKHLQNAKIYGIQNFKKGLLALDSIELMAKNSHIDTKVLADLLIIKLIG